MDEEIYALDRNGNKLFSVSIENPKLFYLVGLPASGKSTKAKELSKIYNAKIHSSDSIREELGDIDNQDNNDLVFRILHNRIFTDLMDGNSVIYDATNIRKKHRIHFLQLLESKKIACKKICFITAKPYERCLIHNIMRHKSVPFEVIKNMYMNFEMPSVYEGFDLVDILYDEENYYKYNLDYELHDLLYVSHDNPRHRMSIGEHMFECEKQMKMKLVGLKELSDIRKESLILSSLYHDIGKSIVKSFRNSKGEPVEHATYYQHHCVGAYDLLFYLFQSKINKELLIRTILLVNQHMKPFDWKNNQNSDKSIMKFINMYGKDLYEDLMLLHQCDLLAH